MLTGFVVSEQEKGRTLEFAVRAHIPACSRNTFYKLLRKKDIKVDGRRVSSNLMLQGGEQVELYLPLLPQERDPSPDGSVPFRIIYEDDALLLVSKEQGISVQPDDSGDACLLDLLRRRYGFSCQLCHRLDRNTGGLLLAGRSEQSAAFWQTAFREGMLRKFYRCLVWGKITGPVPEEWQERHAWLFKDAKQSQVHIYDTPRPYCKEIRTAYRLIRYDEAANVSQLEVRLLTGRTHQIRAHLAHLGYPLLGDGKYGRNAVNKQFPYHFQTLWSSRLELPESVCRRFAESVPSWSAAWKSGPLIWEDEPCFR